MIYFGQWSPHSSSTTTTNTSWWELLHAWFGVIEGIYMECLGLLLATALFNRMASKSAFLMIDCG